MVLANSRQSVFTNFTKTLFKHFRSSFHSTVCIAISGVWVVRSNSENEFGQMHLGGRGNKRSVMAIIGIFLFGVVFNISRWFELEVFEIPDPEKNETIILLQVSDFLYKFYLFLLFGIFVQCFGYF